MHRISREVFKSFLHFSQTRRFDRATAIVVLDTVQRNYFFSKMKNGVFGEAFSRTLFVRPHGVTCCLVQTLGTLMTRTTMIYPTVEARIIEVPFFSPPSTSRRTTRRRRPRRRRRRMRAARRSCAPSFKRRKRRRPRRRRRLRAAWRSKKSVFDDLCCFFQGRRALESPSRAPPPPPPPSSSTPREVREEEGPKADSRRPSTRSVHFAEGQEQEQEKHHLMRHVTPRVKIKFNGELFHLTHPPPVVIEALMLVLLYN
jgi:hypothetical protein